ncbi:preprotein translocase subunit SecG [Allopusillimonas ginsengisoli]|uniref:preprotein translocase subunit SecG n=1 Tax=Allopusillimonas ginsengisoli TaxID=453575 RepID=UPI00101F35F4|nr:preprotein translocase subunit SecG [Allopusillimonas ginsengisoli]TEA79555.1 preprotein translocase subunit SecG [Allopusillimonas ginsengisoli]
MHWLSSALLAIQVISSLSIIALVLLQQGKGADMGSSFGGGSAGSVFGATGAANFLSRTTKWAAIIFFASTGGLAWVSHHPASRDKAVEGVMQGYETPAVPGTGAAVPVAPGSTQGTAVPSAPAPAQPDTNAVPSASDQAAPAAEHTTPPASDSANPSADTAPSEQPTEPAQSTTEPAEKPTPAQ